MTAPTHGAVEAARRTIHDALVDSAYLAGITAGWNAAQADDPEQALSTLRKSREGHLVGFKEAKAITRAHPAPEASADGVIGAWDRPAIMVAARAWWKANMKCELHYIHLGGDGRVKVSWSDNEESGTYTLPVDFALRAPGFDAARDRAEEADRLAGWLIYDRNSIRPEFQAYDLTDADRRTGATSKPVYFAAIQPQGERGEGEA